MQIEKRPRKPTLSEVAALAGVSEITASRALRASAAVTPETLQKVQEAARSLGYLRNRLAGALAGGPSNQVAVILPSLSNIVFPDVLKGLEDRLDDAGFHPVLGISNYDPAQEEHLIRNLLSWRPAGLVIAPSGMTEASRAVLRDAGLPVVEIMDIDTDPVDMAVGMSHRAAGLAMATGVKADTALAALEHLKGAPGRLDLVGTTPAGAPVYVDYSHKPDALENVLLSVRPFTTGKVVVVFGCGGDRDKGKRPIMGGIASRLADIAIVTDDNPRSEVPATIRAEILANAPGATEIGDRREAIRHAIDLLGPGDTLIVAGKGHEEGQTIGSVTHPFSDHHEVRLALAGRAA